MRRLHQNAFVVPASAGIRHQRQGASRQFVAAWGPAASALPLIIWRGFRLKAVLRTVATLWIATFLVSAVQSIALGQSAEQPKAVIVTTSSAPLQSLEGGAVKTLMTVPKGTVLLVQQSQQSWYLVEEPRSKIRGWIDSKHVTIYSDEMAMQHLLAQQASSVAREVRLLSQKKEFGRALAKAKVSVQLHSAAYGESHPNAIRENVAVGWLMLKTGQREEGKQWIEQWVGVEESAGGAEQLASLPTYRFAAMFGRDYSESFARGYYDKIFAVLDHLYANDFKQRIAKRREEVQSMISNRSGEYAERYARQNLDLLKQNQMANTDLAALEYSNLAAIAANAGDPDTAQKYYEQALAIPADNMTAQLRGNLHRLLGEIFERRQDYAATDRHYRQAVEHSRKGYGSRHETTADILFKYGWNKYFLSDYEAAIRHLQESLQIRKQVLKPDSLKIANVHTQLGYVFTMSGELSKSVEHFRAGVAIAEKNGGKDSVRASPYYQGLGFGLGMIDDAEARMWLRKSVRAYERSNTPDTQTKAEAFRRYASQVLKGGDVDEAEQYFKMARAITSTNESMDAFDAMNLRALAAIARRRGDLEESRQLMASALQKLLRTHQPNHQSVLQTKTWLAELDRLQGKLSAAEYSYQQLSKTIQQKLGTHPETIHVLTSLAKTQDQLNQPSEMFQNLASARKLASEYVNQQLSALSPGQQIGYLNGRYKSDFHAALDLAFQNRDEANASEPFLEWLINGKAVSHEALAEYYQHQNPQRTSTIPPTVWRNGNAFVNALPADCVYIDLIKLRPNPRNPSDDQAPIYLAAVVNANDKSIRMVDLGPAEPIDAVVERARKLIKVTGLSVSSLGEQAALDVCNEALAEFTERVWDKLAIGDDNDQVIVCLDSTLWLLPWAALPLKRGSPETVIEKYELRFAVSGRSLLTSSNPKKANRSVIIADPDFGSVNPTLQGTATRSAFQKFAPVPRLPFASVEAKAIASQLQAIDGRPPIVQTGAKASESAVKTVDSPRHLVLTTHGLFLEDAETGGVDDDAATMLVNTRSATGQAPIDLSLSGHAENPLEKSGLILAGFNQTSGVSDDSVLTGREIVELDLSGTHLVVLSACDTAVGEINNGEGVAGLRQAFQLAGARQVVASLWSVEDEQTARLMVDFYKNMASGDNASQSLRAAQLDRIHARRTRHNAAHPFFWAAFTLTGRE